MTPNANEMQNVVNLVVEYAVKYGFNILGAILILVVGWLAARQISRWVAGWLERKQIDVTLTKFTASALKGLVVVFTVMIALSNFGVEITPFIAALGGMVFGATFALQGPLSNYAAGVSIIVSRPFVVGDTVMVCGQYGEVETVKLGATTLLSDGVQVTIPNKHILGEILHNSKGSRLVEGMVGIAYGGDPERAIRCIADALAVVSGIQANPPPQVGVDAFGDSSINIALLFWVPTPRFHELKFAANLAVYHALEQAGIQIPFPQCDVRLLQAN